MYCGKCGTQLKEDANFCPKCGAPTRLPEEKKDPEEQNVSKWILLFVTVAVILTLVIVVAIRLQSGGQNTKSSNGNAGDLPVQSLMIDFE